VRGVSNVQTSVYGGSSLGFATEDLSSSFVQTRRRVTLWRGWGTPGVGVRGAEQDWAAENRPFPTQANS
jgi:hypothetical protein